MITPGSKGGAAQVDYDMVAWKSDGCIDQSNFVFRFDRKTSQVSGESYGSLVFFTTQVGAPLIDFHHLAVLGRSDQAAGRRIRSE